MSVKDQIGTIGKYGKIELSELTIEVKIEDYRKNFGHDEWCVTPVSGVGSLWIQRVWVDGKLLGKGGKDAKGKV